LIHFLDADDLLHPRKLELQTAESLKHPGKLVYCDWTALDVISGEHRVFSYECDGSDAVTYALRFQIPTSTVLHWKSSLNAVSGFREELPCAQDRDLNIRLACSGVGFHHLPLALCTLRRRPGSISADILKVLDQHPDTVRRAETLLRERAGLTEPRAHALAGFLARDARVYLRHGEVGKARLNFREARRLHHSGGLPEAYSNSTLYVRRYCGALITELLVSLKRRLLPVRKPDMTARTKPAGPSDDMGEVPAGLAEVGHLRSRDPDLLDQRNI